MPGFLDDLTGVRHWVYEAGLIRLSFAVAALGDPGNDMTKESKLCLYLAHSVS